MLSIVKITGISIFLLCSILFGFSKSHTLRMRELKLRKFYNGLDKLYEYISGGYENLEKALRFSFDDCDFIKVNASKSFCRCQELTSDDINFINNFLCSLGRSCKKAECERIRLCENTILKRIQQAENECDQKCRLWQSLGICIGLTVSILFI